MTTWFTPRRNGWMFWQLSVSSHKESYVRLYVSVAFFGWGFQRYWYTRGATQKRRVRGSSLRWPTRGATQKKETNGD